ncbi:MAG: disulfide bond formation protein B [Xanthomonadaceae bacterium]|nr:disulfide bond formation protein B [Xanthomonadaceae bacterium]
MLNPFRWPFRAQCFAGFGACIALLAYAYFVQFQLDIEPCPLCIFQRLAFIAIGLVFLAGAIQAPRAFGRRVYAVLVLLGAAVGVGISAYHLWVQHQGPDPMAGCTPGWNYMVENYSLRYAWSKTLEHAFTGHADCAEINWTFLGLAMPFWTLISYVLIGAGAAWAGFRRRDQDASR